ncbi:phosphonate C-P lyase system protein PhnH [Bordetella muralis]|uniref:phosphonate C-P lyase system protein PhnH n=1 Tax=Bordetella muralis TaxID=1649130 RepID=UPI0039EED720
MLTIPTPVPSAPPAAGFADTVMQSQQTFRAALQALAHPGSIHDIAVECGVPPGLSLGMTAMLLALADVDTPVWLPAETDEAVRHYLRFHCGCPLVNEPMQARFAVVPAGHMAPSLAQCDPGDPAYPDASTTLLFEVESLSHDPGAASVVLSGPGIAGQRTLAVTGLPTDFWMQWRANHQLFPLGVDAFLIRGSQLCGLPRTVIAEG